MTHSIQNSPVPQTATPSLSVVILTLTVGLGVVTTTGCGMRPPREFHEAAKAESMDLQPLPEKPEQPTTADAGPDGGIKPIPADSERAELPLAVGLAAVPTMTVSELLGQPRESVEALLDPLGPEDPDDPAGWIRYSDHLKLRFEEDMVVELIQQVPEGKSCLESAKWLGFENAAEPVLEADACRWPADDSAHTLGEGVGGELLQKTDLFRAWTKK